MAVQVSSILSTRLKYPLISSSLLLLFVLLPTFQLLVYFVPLLLSTALCFAAMVTLGPSSHDGGESVVSYEDDKSWLGRIRSLQERARIWLESKLSVAESGGGEELPPEICEEDCPESIEAVKSEHERRVRQLERTLRSLSFVSYEGIFDSDGAAAEMEKTASLDDDVPAPAVDAAAEGGVDAQIEDGAEAQTAEHRINETSPEEHGAPEESKDNQVETMSDDAISWQRVEHTEAQKE